MPRNRSLPLHLEHRPAGYAWRRRVPRSLGAPTPSKPLEREFFCFSLRTHVLRDAKILSARLTALSDKVFAAAAEKTMTIAPEMTNSLLTGLARFEIEAFERSRALAGSRSPEVAALDLEREAALQDTLRRAIYLGDREVARAPLRNVAALLGLALDEADQDWTALAYEATRVLLDVSAERARRQQGIFDQPTVYFRRAVDTNIRAYISPSSVTPLPPVSVTPANLASDVARTPVQAAETPASRPDTSRATHVATSPSVAVREKASGSTPPLSHTVGAIDPDTTIYEGVAIPVVRPFGLKAPKGLSDAQAQENRISMRPPNIHVAVHKLPEASQRALAKARGITLPEAINLFFDLKDLGYQNDFARPQKRDGLAGEKFKKENVSRLRLASDYWPEELGSGPVDEIDPESVNDALERLWRLPTHHGKFAPFLATDGYKDLIERCDSKAAELEAELKRMKSAGATDEEIDRKRQEDQIPRLKVDTYLKHARVLGAVGKMLMDMQLIDVNPFALCVWTNKEVKKLRSRENIKARVAWDDRLHDLFRSPIFQDELEDVGEPLFWAPLIAVHNGLRQEEVLQLGPDDFGYEDGHLYMNVTNSEVNSIKTEASQRQVPVHQNLIDLGIEKLIALRKSEGRIRLFPKLTRGKWKGTLTENFSKKFNYYRRDNEVYRPGLDFHAFRTTVNNYLLSDNLADSIRRRLMGHAPLDEGEKSYAQSLRMKPLFQRLASVEVDISIIRRPFEQDRAIVNAKAKERGLRVVGQ
ncbi:DUF6538 domain-containing protein [Arenibacterium halophilum]|uniref:DUF6538 domain-containing protein n=1 Tax=Arenibacterium halophilum TaxID=2583821 RepID=A0ABY2XD40_9RHOB|nr:DUF6538 domain-containing protein [Arenibacterium halophilum]TMV14583.1 hypothetical protein FGK64_00925 [Arenibacterium halophilum]